MIKKIYVDAVTGNAFWKDENDDLCYASFLTGEAIDLEDGAVADWSDALDEADEAHGRMILAKLA